MKSYLRCLLTLGCILCSTVYALDGKFYFGDNFGVNIATLSNQNPAISYNNPSITDTYSLNSDKNLSGMWGLDSGYEQIGKGFIPNVALGLGMYGIWQPYHYAGQMTETIGNTSQTLYDYRFKLRSYRVMAETKLSWNVKYNILPLIDLGVGPAWNYTSNYSELIAPTNNNSVTLPPFQSKTNTNVAYQVGVGLSYGFNFATRPDNLKYNYITVEYRYVYLGKIALNARGPQYPYSLALGKLIAQEVFLNLTHLF